MSPRIPVAAPPGQRRLAVAEREIRDIRKQGPEPWLYFGSYPTDTFTTYYSPAFQNGFARAGSPFTGADGFPRVRWDEHYRLEFAGVVVMGTSGTTMVTLPEDWRPDVDDFWTAAVLTGTTPTLAQMYVTASTGAVRVTLIP